MVSLSDTSDYVHAEHNTDTTINANRKNTLNYQSLSSAIGEQLTVEQLKEQISLTALLKQDGINIRRSGKDPQCLCPFHSEDTPSFTIYDDRNGHCFGCGWHGDIFSYVQERDGSDFPVAKALLEQQLATGALASKLSRQQQTPTEAKEEPFVLGKELRSEIVGMARHLAGNKTLCKKIAESRGWQQATIEALANDSWLGWEDNALAFVYETGVKLRPWAWAREGIHWKGKTSIWRGSTITRASTVYLTEGESDAISLIDGGICDGGTAVAAIPSATTFKSEWAKQFKDKTVHLCFDNDVAGEKAISKAASLLATYTDQVFAIDWTGLQTSLKDVTDIHAMVGAKELSAVLTRNLRKIGPSSVTPQVATTFPSIISSRMLVTQPPVRPPVLVEGLLHQGSKLILVSGSKSYKTWCLMDLALSIGSGSDWWGRKTQRGRVLYINLEIQDAFFRERLVSIQEARKIPDAVWDYLDLLNLRGHCTDFKQISEQIIRAAGSKYAMIIIDPIYKVLGDRDENSAGDMGELLNEFEKVAVRTGAAVIYGHHFSKGNQSKKESIDRMSGSGVFARDADTLLIMTKHEQENVFVIEPTVRNFKPIPAFCVKWEHPVMSRDYLSNPAKLKQSKANQKKFTLDMLLNVLGAQSLTHKEFKDAAMADTGMSDGTFNKLLRELKDTEKVKQDDKTKKWSANELSEVH